MSALPLQAVDASIARAISALIARQGSDGAWNGRFLASPTGTALYLLTKARLRQRDERSESAVKWLLSRQAECGGWGANSHLSPIVEVTELVLRALELHLPAHHTACTRARSFLSRSAAPVYEPSIVTVTSYWGLQDLPRAYRFMPFATQRALLLAGEGLPAFVDIFACLGMLQIIATRRRTGAARYHGFDLVPWARARLLANRQPCGSWMASMATTMNALAALLELGTAASDPLIIEGMRWVEHWQSDDGGMAIQSAMNVWDTSLVGLALAECRSPQVEASLDRAKAFLRSARMPDGTWSWDSRMESFGIPDWDDTSYASLLLRTGREPDGAAAKSDLLVRRQRSGGWTAFGRPAPVPLGEYFDACIDVTAHVTNYLRVSAGPTAPSINAAVAWILRHQKPDGSWSGVWYARHTYGIQCAVEALVRSGLPHVRPAVGKALVWLESQQNSDGGWGEDWDGVRGPSTVEQTSYAVHALAMGGDGGPCRALERGVDYLLQQQGQDGLWASAPQVGRWRERLFASFNTEDYSSAQALATLAVVRQQQLELASPGSSSPRPWFELADSSAVRLAPAHTG